MSVDNPEQILEKLTGVTFDAVVESPDHYMQTIIDVEKEALAALDVYYKAQVSKDMAEVIGEDEPEDYYNHPDSLAIARNAFREEQRITVKSKGYKVDGE